MRWVATLDIIKGEATTNKALRAPHWTKRNELMAAMKHDFAMLTFEQGNKAPRFLDPVTIEVRIECARRPRAKLVDTDAGYLAAKACVDGLVKAQVIPDDTPEHILWIRHWGPVWSELERDAITLTVESST